MTEQSDNNLNFWLTDTMTSPVRLELPIDYPRESTIHELFQIQAAQTPNLVAIAYKNQEITYHKLDKKSNNLAIFLQNIGVKSETLVGLYLDRCPDLIITILAILKAGGAYLPLDTSAPKNRIKTILEDAQTPILITQKSELSKLQNITEDIQIICVDDNWDLTNITNDIAADNKVNANNLAYVMYTSGSTGKPKGVCVLHRGVIRLVKNTNYAHFGSDEVVLQLASIAFDAATFEIWAPLLNGGKLVLMPAKTPSLQEIGEVIKQYKITTLWLTAGLFNLIVEEQIESLKPLRQLLAGGDVLSIPHVKKVLEELPHCQLINGYGPTENTTFTCCHKITIDDTTKESIPIGRPIANTQVYILDNELKLVPIGVTGELYIGGDGLARGYLNQPHLTTEKFIKNPFSNDPNSRLYKTGDRVCWNKEGNIEFLGRIDFQVKIRGYRVELGEIASMLQEYPDISDVVVVAREDLPGNKQLVAYIIPKKINQDLNIEEVKDYLANKLPDYMIPSVFLVLDKFPLNINGKIDRSALPIPEYYIESELVKPRNTIETNLAEIWQDILGFEVCINQSFTNLGGHSLQATQIVSRIRDIFGVDIPVAAMLQVDEQSTISSLAVSLIQADNSSAITTLQPIVHGNEIPLTVYQERIWLLAQRAETDPIYNLPMVFRLQGNLNINLLEEAINEVIKRHESLRTIFPIIKGLPRQRILRELKIKIDIQDVTIADLNRIENLVNDEASKYFNLEKDALIRVKLLNLGVDDYILMITCHHIISDGWSLAVLLKEIRAHYNALEQKYPVKLPELNLNYGDFSLWYQQVKEQRETVALEYWKKQLEGVSPVLTLPTDYSRPPLQTFKGSIQYFEINQDLRNKLESLGQKNGATLFMVLLATFQILLHRYSNQEDIVIGTPIANRNHTAWENLIGCFVNVVPLRSNVANNPSFQEFLAQIKKISLEAYTYPDFPLEKLLSQQQYQRDLSYSPLFQVMFVLLNVPDNGLELPGLTITEQKYNKGATIFDLTFLVEEKPQGLKCSVEYNTALYADETITRLMGHFQVLLESIITNPEQPVKRIPLLTKGEEKQLLEEWNQTKTDYPKNICIPQLFEAQVQKTPNNIAVIFEQQEITYQELNQRANQLASYLRELGVKPDTLVGICLERSLEMIITLFAILKAGGAYVSIDSKYPSQRISSIISDSQISLLITTENLVSNFLDTSEITALNSINYNQQLTVIYLEKIGDIVSQKNQKNLINNIEPVNLAYILYTSGSTGKPKGVAITHHSSINFIHWAQTIFQPEQLTGVLAATSICFDLSIFEIFVPLTMGGKIILAENVIHLLTLTRAKDVTLINTVPSAIAALLKAKAIPDKVKTVNLAGEPLSQQIIKQLYQQPTIENVFNLYGPSETTTYSTFTRCVSKSSSTDKISHALSIGRPIANTQIYILDEQLQPLPIGIPGELYIGGDGLAKGYLNRPDLTKEKFITNPFGNGKLYKTGDLVRYLVDGNIEFLGRIDNQVKIRGFRIELGEIETVLNEYPQIDSGLVIVREEQSENKHLVAYVVAELETFNSEKLRSFLKEKLPEYMIPRVFVRLEKFPLTPNGKIDRSALPAPEYNLEHELVKPRNTIETCLAAIWQDILGFEVGINQSFTNLGGHSLQATQIVSRIRDIFGVDIPLIVMLQDSKQSQISSLAVIITNKLQSQNEDKIISLQPIVHGNEIPLTVYQERIWLLAQRAETDPIYNLPMVFRLQGNLKINLLEEAINEVIKRHESLRTIFPIIKGLPRQRILSELKIKIDIQDVTITDLSSLENLVNDEASKYFNLEKDALIRVKLLNLGVDDHILMITCHHIISDGWSLGVLLKEIRVHYNALQQKYPVKLPELNLNYGDFSLWYQQVKEQRETVALEYWKKQLEGASPVLTLPTDYPRPPLQTFKGSIQYFEINQDLRNKLESLGQKNGATLFMVLLATFQILLHRYSNQEDIVIGTPIANRNHTAWENLIGCFVNVVPLRSNVENNPSFQEFLAQIKKISLEAYTYPDFPLEKLLSQQQYQRDLSYSPLFQVMFVLLNVPDNGLELPGLKITEKTYNTGATIFDLTFLVEEKPQGLKCSVEYNTALYADDTITRLMGHFQVLLESIITNPEQPVKRIPLLTQGEEKQLSEEWNQTKVDYPKNICIPQLFEAQVQKTPNNIAVIFEQQEITYQELNQKANQLAHYLQDLGVKSETLVGIYLQSSVEMIVALLGILKAGGTYLPLEPNYPQERINYMLENAKISLLVSVRSLRKNLSEYQGKIVIIDENKHYNLQKYQANPTSDVKPNNLAYIIYTSGSTGTPKGVQIEHQSLINLLFAFKNQLKISEKDIWLAITTLCFDIAALEIFLPLITGAKLHLVSRQVARDGTKLLKTLNQSNATILQATPTTWQMLLLAGWLGSPQLTMLTGGETLSQGLAKQLLSKGHRLYNVYGPTETTIWSLSDCITNETEKISIGRPIANTEVYILDEQLQPVPIGIPGELYIGGDGLARGYLNRPELTTEKFINSPFNKDKKLYKTGDLACYQKDGKIYFLGRIDRQVKIRGFRIELGEIETILSQHIEIREAVVTTINLTDEAQTLIAYIIPQNQPFNQVVIKDYLKQKIPNYMIPSFFKFLKEFPLTANEKINYQALPSPNLISSKTPQIPIKPETELELRLVNIWEQVLNIKSISLQDNFFDLGGHSLLAMRILAKIEQEFNLNIPLSNFLQIPTVESLVQLIKYQNNIKQESSVVAVQNQGKNPPLFFINSISQAKKLGNLFDKNQPFYIINIFGITEFLKPQINSLKLEDIAAKFIEDMQTIQPHGPYFLLTYCGDSFLTFEMAQQLQIKGEKIALLGFIDSIWEPQDLGLYLSWYNLRQFGLNYLVERFKNRFFWTKEKFIIRLKQWQGQLFSKNNKPLPRYIEDVRLLKAFELARNQYSPQSYSGKVTLFISQEYRLLHSSKLESLVTECVEIQEIPGYHHTLFQDPYVEILVQKIQRTIDNG